MLNWIWSGLILISILTAAYNGQMEALTNASIDSAKEAVTLAISLIGVMAFWLGLMKIAEDGGLLRSLSRKVRPLMVRLFPDVPADHPALSAMIMNISANMLGLGNAATPFGIKAMMELNRLNKKKGVATNAMCLFLAINASNVSIFPLGVIALRGAIGSKDPAGIFASTLISTACATIVAIIAAKFFSKLPYYLRQWSEAKETAIDEAEITVEDMEPGPIFETRKTSAWVRWLAILATGAFLGFLVSHVFVSWKSEGLLAAIKNVLGQWLIPALIGALLLYGLVRGVKVYESVVEGAKEGFQVAIRIIPFLVAILVAVAMFRASGAMAVLIRLANPITALIGMPGEALPMALLRPLSGSGAYGLMTEIMKVHGPDSFLGYLVSTLQGSTETTFYVLAVYFGAVQVKVIRHALPACLTADVAGTLAAVWICRLLFL